MNEETSRELARHIGKTLLDLMKHMEEITGHRTYHVAAIVFPTFEGRMSAPQIFTTFGKDSEGLMECGKVMCQMSMATAMLETSPQEKKPDAIH